MKIACPKCAWRPQPNDQWICSCGHVWHTFATRGVCPACGKVWRQTQCLACIRWSDHEDWYHAGDDDAITIFTVEPEEIAGPVGGGGRDQFLYWYARGKWCDGKIDRVRLVRRQIQPLELAAAAVAGLYALL